MRTPCLTLLSIALLTNCGPASEGARPCVPVGSAFAVLAVGSQPTLVEVSVCTTSPREASR